MIDHFESDAAVASHELRLHRRMNRELAGLHRMFFRGLPGGIGVVADGVHARTERRDRLILVRVVAVRNENGARRAMLLGSERERETVITARRRDETASALGRRER